MFRGVIAEKAVSAFPPLILASYKLTSPFNRHLFTIYKSEEKREV